MAKPEAGLKTEAEGGGVDLAAEIASLRQEIARREVVFSEYLAILAGRIYLLEVGLHSRSSASTDVTGIEGLKFVMGATRGSYEMVKRNYKRELLEALGQASGDTGTREPT